MCITLGSTILYCICTNALKNAVLRTPCQQSRRIEVTNQHIHTNRHPGCRQFVQQYMSANCARHLLPNTCSFTALFMDQQLENESMPCSTVKVNSHMYATKKWKACHIAQEWTPTCNQTSNRKRAYAMLHTSPHLGSEATKMQRLGCSNNDLICD